MELDRLRQMPQWDTSTFLGEIRQLQHDKKIKELEVNLQNLNQVNEHDPPQQEAPQQSESTNSHEECPHCGMIGTIKINVHRHVQQCCICHREFDVKHFHETTGTTIQTTSTGRYCRREHFMSTLKKLQAQRAVRLPPTLLGHVLQYLKTHFGVKRPKDVEYFMMKTALSKTGFAKKVKHGGKGDYSDHVMTIYCQLTKRKPPRFSIKQTKRLIRLFDKLLVVFDQALCDVGIDRANWLSYEFTVYKLCEKEKFDAMKQWCGILKGPQTLKIQDMIMGRMFELNDWPPIKTEHTKNPSAQAPSHRIPMEEPAISQELFQNGQNPPKNPKNPKKKRKLLDIADYFTQPTPSKKIQKKSKNTKKTKKTKKIKKNQKK